MNMQVLVVLVLFSIISIILAQNEARGWGKRRKQYCDKIRPANTCPKEISSLFITCGERDITYMQQLENYAMQTEDLLDPTRCLRYRFDDIVSTI